MNLTIVLFAYYAFLFLRYSRMVIPIAMEAIPAMRIPTFTSSPVFGKTFREGAILLLLFALLDATAPEGLPLPPGVFVCPALFVWPALLPCSGLLG